MTAKKAKIGDNEIADLVQSIKDEWSAIKTNDDAVNRKTNEAEHKRNEAQELDDEAEAIDQSSESRRVLIGEFLIKLKALIPYGQFEATIAERFPERSLREHQRCMALAGADDPAKAEQEARDADAQRKREERAKAAEAKYMAEYEAARIATAEEAEKRRTAAASVASTSALAAIDSAKAAPSADAWAAMLPKAAPAPAASVVPFSETKPQRARREFQEWLSRRDTMPWRAWCDTGLNLVAAYRKIPEFKWSLGEVDKYLRMVDGLKSDFIDREDPDVSAGPEPIKLVCVREDGCNRQAECADIFTCRTQFEAGLAKPPVQRAAREAAEAAERVARKAAPPGKSVH